MKTGFKSAAAAIMVLSAAALQSQTRPDAAGSRSGTGGIRGRVLAEDSDTPLRNARVDIASETRSLPPGLTDGDGRFSIAALPPGRYTISATKPGYVGGARRDRRAAEPIRIDVADGALVGGVDVRLPKAGVVEGRVVDDFGEPVVRATVTVESSSEAGEAAAAPIATTLTNDLGEYRIGGLPRGRFVVSLNAPPAWFAGHTSDPGSVRARVFAPSRVRLYFPGALGIRDAVPIELQPGEAREGVDFSIAPGQFGAVPIGVVGTPTSAPVSNPSVTGTGVVRGRVLRVDGLPIRQAEVGLVPADGGGGWAATTDDTGGYEFPRLPSGEYTLSARKVGYAHIEFGQRAMFEPGQTIRLGAGETRDHVDISLPRDGAIVGRVLDDNGEPVEGARVQLLEVGFAAGRQTLVDARGVQPRLTDDLGRYRLHGIQPGRYVLRAVVGHVDDLHQPPADIPGFASTYFPGTPNASNAQAVGVGLSEDVSGIDFALARVPTARVAGVAFNSAGEPVLGGLFLTPSRRSSALAPTAVSARIDRDGSFEFTNVTPGEYVLQALMGRTNASTEGEFASRFVVVAGTDVADLLIRTSPGSTIAGRVIFEDAVRPRASGFGAMEVSAVPIDPDLSPSTGPPARAEIHDDWTFELGGATGPRRLRVSQTPEGWALKAMYLNGVDVTDATLAFGRKDQSVRDLQVVLTNRTTEISGTVTGARGRRAPDCTVIAYATDSARWGPGSRFLDTAGCTRNGSFVMRKLPPGEYFIAAVGRTSTLVVQEWQNPQWLGALASRARRVTLTDGQTLPLTLTLLGR